MESAKGGGIDDGPSDVAYRYDVAVLRPFGDPVGRPLGRIVRAQPTETLNASERTAKAANVPPSPHEADPLPLHCAPRR